MCWGAQRNQRPQDLETGCHTRSLLQLHCQNDDVGTQCPVHLWDPPETCWEGLLDDLYWRQISVYWNRLSDPWWRIYTGVCVQAALLAQMKRKSSRSILLPQDKAVVWFLCHIRTPHVEKIYIKKMPWFHFRCIRCQILINPQRVNKKKINLSFLTLRKIGFFFSSALNANKLH